MFDIGFLELLLLGVVGLLVLGPERLPKAARTLGLWIGRIKRTVSGMQREINAQLEAEELRQKLKEQQQKLDEGVRQVKQGVESLADEPDQATPASPETPPKAPSPEQRLDDALARTRLGEAPGDASTPAETSSAELSSAEPSDSDKTADKDASSR